MGAQRRTCAIGQAIGMLQDTAASARPSELACRRVLRSSGKIMQIRTKTNGTERVPWCVQLGSNDDQSCSDTDNGHVTYSESSLISFRKPSRAHRRAHHYVDTPTRFSTPREHWPPPVSQRVDEIGNVSFLRPIIHVRSFHYIFGFSLVSPDLSGCTSRDHDLPHNPKETPTVCENLEAIKSVLVALKLMTGACWDCSRRRHYNNSVECSSFLLNMCMDAQESTTNSLSSSFITDGAGRNHSLVNEKKVALSFL